uniref:NADH-ubiquinone oxidoreductase chain 3 n=1 Tax=Leiodidae sp. BMNH 1274324 TaxID=1796521 RepID=A0A126TFC5_9COLE|nr:NADH dehydrogenase subunit 3 [Leiodidae sp. BMNH 1274324]
MILLLNLLMIIIFSISFLLMLICLIISKKSFMDREKNSPFECGFDPKSSPRISFSIHFFLIAMIFLIFDVEITLLIPLILIMNLCNLIMFLKITFIFLIILLLGTYHEWIQGSLNWSN